MEVFTYFVQNYILIPHADAVSKEFIVLLGRINEHIINPLIVLLFTGALIMFVIGLYNFFHNKSESNIEQGKQHILWGVFGMAVMISVFGIMRFITGTLGINDVNPEQPGSASVLIDTNNSH